MTCTCPVNGRIADCAIPKHREQWERLGQRSTPNPGGTMTELTNFLLARIADDEERGRDLVAQWWDVGNACQSCGTNGKRVLAECEAKRRIVQAARSQLAKPGDDPDDGMADLTYESVLALLALPYADHPDYREEWRP